MLPSPEAADGDVRVPVIGALRGFEFVLLELVDKDFNEDDALPTVAVAPALVGDEGTAAALRAWANLSSCLFVRILFVSRNKETGNVLVVLTSFVWYITHLSLTHKNTGDNRRITVT